MIKIEKELKKEIEEKLGTKIISKPNNSYCALWIKVKKQSHLVLCYFKGKRTSKLCLPWSSINLLHNNNLKEIVNEFLAFKVNNSISKAISKLEKQLKEKGLIEK